jgi:hypothetical protein
MDKAPIQTIDPFTGEVLDASNPHGFIGQTHEDELADEALLTKEKAQTIMRELGLRTETN